MLNQIGVTEKRFASLTQEKRTQGREGVHKGEGETDSQQVDI